MRSTHTYAVLEISPEAHAEIKAKLLAAGYAHAIDGETIDMHGIALEPPEEWIIRARQMQAIIEASHVMPNPPIVVDWSIDPVAFNRP